MVLPLPKIEGFQPIPNAVMIPFMEAQSAALAYGFGLNYEYGKRKIRSMSNEQYNSLTSEDITNMSNNHTHIILSKFQEAVPRVMPMQQEIFKQYVTIEKAKVIQNIELAKWIVDYLATGTSKGIEDFYAHLTGEHAHSTDTPPLPPSTINPDRPTTLGEVQPTGIIGPPAPPPTPPPSISVASPDSVFPRISKFRKFTANYAGRQRSETLSSWRSIIKIVTNLAVEQTKKCKAGDKQSCKNAQLHQTTIMQVNADLSKQLGTFFR